MKTYLFTILYFILIINSYGDARPVIDLKKIMEECHKEMVIDMPSQRELLNSESKLVRMAALDIGVKEGSYREVQIANRSGISGGSPWCAAAVSEWLVKCGVNVKRTPVVSDLKYRLKNIKTYKTPRVGAVVFYEWSHVGIVAKINKDHSFWAIEGNCDGEVKVTYRTTDMIEYFKYIE
jgi:hypothetical protein